MLASFEGYLDVVKELLQHPKIDINLQDRNGDTALMHAATRGRLGVVRELLKRPGIDVNLQNRYGDTALMRAARRTGHLI